MVDSYGSAVVQAFLENALDRVDHPLSPEEALESEQLER